MDTSSQCLSAYWRPGTLSHGTLPATLQNLTGILLARKGSQVCVVCVAVEAVLFTVGFWAPGGFLGVLGRPTWEVRL